MGTNSQRDTRSIQESNAPTLRHLTLSICIVTYQSKIVLKDCLRSIFENTNLKFEVIVVDNGSTDNVIQMLEDEFPLVHITRNEKNEGYTIPMNQAMRKAQGQFLLQINPDTIVLPESLDKLVSFMKENPNIGICGPKVLNADLTLQRQCRRGEPTPWAVITYFLGLWKLFPKSKIFGQYLLNYIDEDIIHTVDGVSGSCMLIRREVIDHIGYLDERFFAYQEDADFCYRARQAGWKIYYMPEAEIIHFGGIGGSRVEPYRSIIAWHKSYFLYYQKNLANRYLFLINWIFYLLMLMKLLTTLLINSMRKEKIAGPPRPTNNIN
jgi:GT2 family glycosyltransferase